MSNRVNWNGAAVRRQFDAMISGRIKAACIFLENQVKEDISQSGTLRYNPMGKRGKPLKTQKTVYNLTHSRPGNPPYKQTGTLRRAVGHEVKGLRGRVGVDLAMARYGKFLELGTSKMAARPFLRPALRNNAAQIKAVIEGKAAPGALAVASNQFRSGVLGRGAKRAGY